MTLHSPPALNCRQRTVVMCLCALLLSACNQLTRPSRFTIPPPPRPTSSLETPAPRTPALASSLAAPAKNRQEDELMAFFAHWRDAWMNRDFDAYLTHYAPAFAGNTASSLRWQTRRHRMVQGKSAQSELRFGPPSVEIEDDEHARMSFAQHFTDGELREIGTRQWQLRQIGGRWLIDQEIFERPSP